MLLAPGRPATRVVATSVRTHSARTVHSVLVGAAEGSRSRAGGRLRGATALRRAALRVIRMSSIGLFPKLKEDDSLLPDVRGCLSYLRDPAASIREPVQ